MEWNDVDPREGGSGGAGGGKSKFLNLKPGEYRIRPIGTPEEINRYFIQGPEGRKIAISGKKGNDCIIMRKYRDENGEPLYPQRVRYAFNCIDRADGLLKIVEVPATVARAIRDWGKKNEVNPGSGKGCDFWIKVVRQGSDPRNTKYEVTAGLQTPYTQDERDMLEKTGIYDLKEMFKPVPQDQIEAALGLVAGGSAPAPSTNRAASAPAARPAAASNSSGDDDFPRRGSGGGNSGGRTAVVESDDIPF